VRIILCFSIMYKLKNVIITSLWVMSLSVLCCLICQVQNVDWRVRPTPMAALLCYVSLILKGFDPCTFTDTKLLYNCKRSAWFFLHFVRIKNSCPKAIWASSMTLFSEWCTLYQVNTSTLIISIDNRWTTYIFDIEKEWSVIYQFWRIQHGIKYWRIWLMVQ
jgi:hypothetical protein